ncbi:MAG: hypothetical protein RLZZ77_434 [Bacteroidota bacterium]
MIRQIIKIVFGLLISSSAIGQVTFQANTTNGCTPLGVVIDVTSPSAGSISSYSWTITAPDGSTLTSSSDQYVGILSDPGQYDVSLTVNGNQTQAVSNYITVYAKPVASFTVNDPEGCFPLCVTFSSTSTPGSGPITNWNWDFGNGSTSTQQSPTNCYSNTGLFTPILSVSDINGCFGSVTMPQLIEVVDLFPNASFSPSTVLTCTPPEVVSFTNSSTGNSALTSSWSFGDGQTSTQAGNTSHSFATTGTYEVCLTVTDNIGCQNEECQNIEIFDQPTLTITNAPNTACAGSTVSFSAESLPAGGTITWDFDNNGTTDATGTSVNYVFTNTGSFTPTVTVTYSASCSTSEQTNITITPGITGSFSASAVSSCSVPFTTTFTNTTSGSGITSEWFIDGVSVSASNNFNHTFTTFGDYDVTLVATNSNGCSSTVLESNYISLQPPVINFNHPPAACIGNDVAITALTVTNTTQVTNYEWDFNNDGTIDAVGENPVYSYTAMGQFSITLHVTTIEGCTASFTHPQNITVVQDVQTNITASTQISCAGESIEFCVDSEPGNQFAWNFDDGTGWISMEADLLCITHDYQDTGYFDVSLTVFNGVCNTTQILENYIYITPPVAIFDYAVTCENIFDVEFGDQSIEAEHLIWNFGDGSPEINDQEIVNHTFPAPGTYEVTLTAINDLLGCPDVATTQIVIQPADPGLSFQASQGCPPVLVALNSTQNNSYWNVQISNGDSLIVTQNMNTGVWTSNYYHNGQTQTIVTGANQNHWPQLEFSDAGCYDFAVTCIDANGCENTVEYNDAVCVSTDSQFGDFASNVISSCDPFQVQFESSNTAIVSWDWVFSDGAVASGNNVTHTFLPPFYPNIPLTATLTAVNDEGCTSVVTQTINAASPITPSFAVTGNTTCIGQEVVFTNTTPGQAVSYTWNFGDPSSALNVETTTDASHAYSANGNYTVCLSADNGAGCIQTTCMNNGVQVLNPNASFTFSSTITNCLYGVTFENTSTGAVDQIEWLFGDDQTGAGDQAYHTYPIGVYQVALIASNNFGCVDTSIVYDIFNYGDLIGPYSTVLDNANCVPYTVDFSAYNPNDTYFTYFWDFNDGNGDPSGSTTTTHDYLATGTYCPSIILTDPNGCQVLVECTEPIVVQEFAMEYSYPSEICNGDTIHLSIENGDNYSWNNAIDVTSGAHFNEFDLHPTQDTQLLLTGYYSDCVRTDTLNIIVNPLPTVSLTFDPSICQFDDVIILDGGSPQGATGYYTIDGLISTSFDPSWATQDYEVTYFFTDTLGCTNSAEVITTIHGLPVVTLNALPEFCSNDALYTLVEGSPVGGEYSFNGSTINQFNPSVGAGVHTLLYTYTDAFGCVGSDTNNATVHGAPVPNIQMNNVCQDLAFVANNTSTVANGTIVSSEWLLDNTINSTQNPLVINETLALGLHQLQLEIESSFGCVTLVDSTFQVYPVPVPSFLTQDGCQYSDLPLVSTSTISSGTIEQYIWNIEGVDYTDDDSISHPFQTWGTNLIDLVTISNFGCDSTMSMTLMVYPAPVVDLEVLNACEDVSTLLDSHTTIPLGGIVSYQWNTGDGLPETSSSMIDHTYSEAGTYGVSFTAVSNIGCTTTTEQLITIYATPNADFAIVDSTVCSGTALELIDLSEVSSNQHIAQWEWYLDGNLISEEQNPQSDFSEPGYYDLRLNVETNNGCFSDTIQQQALFLMPTPEAGFRVVDADIDMGAPVLNLRDRSSEDAVEWIYDMGNGEIVTTEDVRYTYQTWGNYLIEQIVINAFGCSDTAQSVVQVRPSTVVYVPNAFTPDGNGHNDCFYPVLSGFELESFDLQIFDRWGKLVYRSHDAGGCWNGEGPNGEMSADGAYTWQLDLKATTSPVIHREVGSVILIK